MIYLSWQTKPFKWKGTQLVTESVVASKMCLQIHSGPTVFYCGPSSTGVFLGKNMCSFWQVTYVIWVTILSHTNPLLLFTIIIHSFFWVGCIFGLFNFLTCWAKYKTSVDKGSGPLSSVSLPCSLQNLMAHMGPSERFWPCPDLPQFIKLRPCCFSRWMCPGLSVFALPKHGLLVWSVISHLARAYSLSSIVLGARKLEE